MKILSKINIAVVLFLGLHNQTIATDEQEDKGLTQQAKPGFLQLHTQPNAQPCDEGETEEAPDEGRMDVNVDDRDSFLEHLRDYNDLQGSVPDMSIVPDEDHVENENNTKTISSSRKRKRLESLPSESQTEEGPFPPSYKRLDRGDALKSDGLPEGGFNALPYELVAVIISSLPRNDQASVRDVSRKMKEIIDEYLWPNQSCTMRGEYLSSAIDAIKSLPFRSLTLKFKRWGSEDLRSLFLLTGLTTLNVSGNQIGAAGAEALSKLAGLTTLKVRYNYIDDAGAVALSKLNRLTTLDVRNNQIGDAGKRELQKLSHLGVKVDW